MRGEFMVMMAAPRSIFPRLLALCLTWAIAGLANVLAAPGDVARSFQGSGSVSAFSTQLDEKIFSNGYTTSSFSRPGAARLIGGSIDSSFNGDISGTVNAMATLPNGQLVIAGNFTSVRGVARNNVALLNSDGSLDMSFDPNTNGTVYCLAVDADGKVLIGGDFTWVGLLPRNRVARLNADGTADSSFDPDVNGTVNCIAIQPDGAILAGGAFTMISGVSRSRMGRLNPDGTLDQSFAPSFGDQVLGMVVQSDRKIVVYGFFLSVNGVARGMVARILADGTLDGGFSVFVNGNCNALALQADGKLILGGFFTAVGSVTRNRIARLNADGTLDLTFNPNANSTALALMLQRDGTVWVGGSFTTVGGVSSPGIVQLFNDSASESLTQPDQTQVLWSRGGAAPELTSVSFQSSLDNGVTWTALGKGRRVGLTASWEITGVSVPVGAKVRAIGRTSGGYRNGSTGLVRQESSITLPIISAAPTAVPATGSKSNNTSGEVLSVVLGPDGGESLWDSGFVLSLTSSNPSPVIGGTGVTAASLGAVNGSITALWGGLLPGASYSLRSYATNSAGTSYSPVTTFTTATFGNGPGEAEATFNANIGSNTVYGVVTQFDGAIVISGDFTTVGGVGRNRMARLKPDGSLDTSFNPNVNDIVTSLYLQADGKILISGLFTSVGGVTRNRIARLNADGSLDLSFDPNANGTVYSMLLQDDGKLLLAGAFTTIGGVTRNRIARLNADNSLDTAFNPNADGTVYSAALQSDGKIVIGGAFTTIGGTSRAYVARLNPDGSRDSWPSTSISGSVYCVALQPDGRVLLGGQISTVGGASHKYMARIRSDGAVDRTFEAEANGEVYSMVVQADAKTYVMGLFSTVGSTTRNSVARLNADATLDKSFFPAALSSTNATIQSDGRVLFGGNFSSFGGTVISRLVRGVNAPASQNLSVPDPSRVLWSRSGGGPSISAVTFEASADNGATWTVIGSGSRIGTSEDWQLTNVSITAGAKVRATGRTNGGYRNNSSGIVRQVFPITSASFSGPATCAASGTTTASLSANVTADGGGMITERGIVFSKTSLNDNPQLDGTSVTKIPFSGTTGLFTAGLTGLSAHTSYSFRAYAINSAGTSYTTVGSFTTANTSPAAPTGMLMGTTGDALTVTLNFPSVDADGDSVTITGAVSGSGVTVNGFSPTTVTFTPNANFVGSGNFTCTLSDGFGGSSTGTIGVTISDNDPPLLTLNGSSAVSIAAESSYQDGGASAFDMVNGGVPVVVTGTVNTEQPGVYTINYSASDAAGNTANATRVVTVTATPLNDWRRNAFGAQAGNPAISGDLADPNANGLVNLLEYALGGDPLAAANSVQPVLGRDAGNHLCISFSRFADRSDVTLTILGADAPSGPWNELAKSVAGDAFTPLQANVAVIESVFGVEVKVTVSDRYQLTDPAHVHRFLRLNVNR